MQEKPPYRRIIDLMTDRLPRRRRRIPALLLAIAHAGLFVAQIGCSYGASASWPLIKKAIRLRNPSVAQLSTTELASWLARPDTTLPLLLDIRAPEEFQISHLQDARLATELAGGVAGGPAACPPHVRLKGRSAGDGACQ